MSKSGLAHLLVHRHRYGESAVLYERACAGYSTMLGGDHPSTRACRQRYSDMFASQEQDRLAVPPTIPHRGVKHAYGQGIKALTWVGEKRASEARYSPDNNEGS
jgi:hypothetical protein